MNQQNEDAETFRGKFKMTNGGQDRVRNEDNVHPLSREGMGNAVR